MEVDYHDDGHYADQYNKEVFFQLCRFYWILDQPTGRELQEHNSFRQWMVDFANDWGSYLNTPESVGPEQLKSFIDGEFDAPDNADDGYEFCQTRGVLIQESPIGLVATIPIGMAQVSSVNMTAVEGAYLNKGDEFGYFLFGGSDIILLFEERSNITINAAPGVHYNSGMCIGEAPC